MLDRQISRDLDIYRMALKISRTSSRYDILLFPQDEMIVHRLLDSTVSLIVLDLMQEIANMLYIHLY